MAEEAYCIRMEFHKPHNLCQLADELAAAGLPYWEYNWDIGDTPNGDPDYFFVGYPSDADPSLNIPERIQAVVDAHVPKPPAPPPDPWAEIQNQIAAATTLDELKAALLGTAPGAKARIQAELKPE